MRRGQIFLISLLVVLVAVPVAAAKDTPDTDKPSALIVSTVAPVATGVTSDHATLQAKVVPGVLSAVAAFQYGPTTSYGSTVTAAPAVLPLKGTTATATVSGLAPATTYHVRVVVSALGFTLLTSADATFTTPAAPADTGSDDKGKDDKQDESGEQAPPPVVAPAPPVLGQSVAVGPVAGKVRVRKPNGKGFVTLSDGADVPSGSVVDATSGTVALTSALDTTGTATQTAQFHGAAFKVVQAKHGKGMIDIYLRGSLGRCPSHGARVASIASKKRKTRSLWGRDHGGRFRTHGASSVATVRGTRWLTQDSCAGTLTKVTVGAVSVRDLHRHKTVTVQAGHSYLARRH
jgi:hypothetical protein